MKKFLTTLFVLSSFSSMVYAEMGVKIGISGNLGVFEAKAVETEDNDKGRQDDAMGVFGYGSIFAEKTLGSRFAVGIDYVPTAIESETVDEKRTDQLLSSTENAVTQKVQVDFEDLTTIYALFNVTENLYVKAGMSQVDVITNEKLGTGSKYGNASLDGITYGVGYDKAFGSGMFFRVEGNVMQFDSHTFTSSVKGADGTVAKTFNKVNVDEFNGASAKISIGKTF